jgi:hypothetical protein
MPALADTGTQHPREVSSASIVSSPVGGVGPHDVRATEPVWT